MLEMKYVLTSRTFCAPLGHQIFCRNAQKDLKQKQVFIRFGHVKLHTKNLIQSDIYFFAFG
jgi:hypothetical protein